MKAAKLLVLVSLVLLLVGGCESSDEFTSSLFSKKEGKLQVYILFSDYDSQVNSSLKEEIVDHLDNYLTDNATVITLHDQTDRIINIFNVEEFPSILVLDHKDVLLQTTDPDEYKEFINQYYSDSR
ncbi:hypothetical protein HNO89_002104 [Sporosarcina luteola]|nr:hypothetical protein [Sporosarcina luteola]